MKSNFIDDISLFQIEKIDPNMDLYTFRAITQKAPF